MVSLDINDLVREVVALVQRELFSHQVSLRIELAPVLPSVVADRVQLQQVIINLVMNGIEAMQSVTDRPRELVVRSSQDQAGQPLIIVADCGVGISAENAVLHHQIRRHGYGAFDLPFDHTSPRWPAVGHG
jgi:C4-dicarboxylate-specific signal transduction histidine kinase